MMAHGVLALWVEVRTWASFSITRKPQRQFTKLRDKRWSARSIQHSICAVGQGLEGNREACVAATAGHGNGEHGARGWAAAGGSPSRRRHTVVPAVEAQGLDSTQLAARVDWAASDSTK